MIKIKVSFILECPGECHPEHDYQQSEAYEKAAEEAHQNGLFFIEEVKKDWHCADFNIGETDIEEVD